MVSKQLYLLIFSTTCVLSRTVSRFERANGTRAISRGQRQHARTRPCAGSRPLHDLLNTMLRMLHLQRLVSNVCLAFLTHSWHRDGERGPTQGKNAQRRRFFFPLPCEDFFSIILVENKEAGRTLWQRLFVVYYYIHWLSSGSCIRVHAQHRTRACAQWLRHKSPAGPVGGAGRQRTCRDG